MCIAGAYGRVEAHGKDSGMFPVQPSPCLRRIKPPNEYDGTGRNRDHVICVVQLSLQFNKCLLGMGTEQNVTVPVLCRDVNFRHSCQLRHEY